MARRAPHDLVYDPEVGQHLLAIERKYHSLIRRQIERQLRYQPEVETRNRKSLLRPSAPGSVWELRFGPDNRFRVLYEIDQEKKAVGILAIGIKDRNRLLIGTEEFE